MESNNKTYLTSKQVAQLLMVTPVTVRDWATKGRLKSTSTLGGHRRFLKVDVEAFAREQGVILQSSGSAQKILIVDDDDLVAEYLIDLLEDTTPPVIVERAANGFEAGRKSEQFCPDVVLLDLMMPGLDGFAVCKQLKQDPLTRSVRIIAMTGFYTDENVKQIKEAGAETLLRKPIDVSQLFSLLGLQQHTSLMDA